LLLEGAKNDHLICNILKSLYKDKTFLERFIQKTESKDANPSVGFEEANCCQLAWDIF